jgi:hypothetical protein
MRAITWTALPVAALGLSGCLSTTIGGLTSPTAPTPGIADAPVPYSVEKLVGAWGVASYREEKDRARTETQARSQCRLPYIIKRGPTDGVIMHVADDATPHELALKKGPDGKVYLGFAGPPGDSQDRVILSMTEKEFVTRYVDPDTNTRYGTFVYVRCAKA